MSRKNQQIKDPALLNKIILSARIIRVAMNDNGYPYILPFNFGFDDNSIYIHAGTEGKKLDLLKKDNKVGFEIEGDVDIIQDEKACKWSTFYQSVIGKGRMEIITSTVKKTRGLEIIMAHHGAKPPFHFNDKQIAATVILKLPIESMTGKKSSNHDQLIAAWQYHFTTERIKAREVRLKDLQDIHHLHSFPEVDEFNTMGIPKNLDETLQGIEPFLNEQNKATRKLYLWTLRLKETEAFVGLAGLSLSLDKFRLGEMFYKLLPSAWGKGYATEIAKSLIERGFKDFHLHKMEAGVATGNTRSIKVLEKCGMTREGTRRKILPIRGKWLDNYHYAIVEDDGNN